MPIDPYLVSQFVHIERFGGFAEVMGDPEGDAAFHRFSEDPQPWIEPSSVSVTEEIVPGPHGEIRVRIYSPEHPSSALAPGLLWMHGGAFVAGSIDMNESRMVCAELAARARAVCITADYRLVSAEVRYPIPLDDVVAAWEWSVDAAPRLGIGPDRMFIGGASAGGNLAAAAAMRLRDDGRPRPAGMLLAYPLVHFPLPALESEIVIEMAGIPTLLQTSAASHEQIIGGYLGRITNVPAGVAPGNFELANMPAAFIAVDEYDDLRPSGELFARQLRASGVAAEVQIAEGMLHGHLNRTPWLDAVDRTLDFFAEALDSPHP